MIGTFVNAGAILIGSLIGGVFKKLMSDKINQVLMNAMGLAAFGLGINAVVQNMPKSEYPVLFIVSLALGGLFGTILDLNGKLNKASKATTDSTDLKQGLVTGCLLFCIGTLSILGPVQAALNNDHTFLFTNASLDLVTSMVLASTYGIGMIIAAPVLFCWQGSIYMLALWLGDFMSESLLAEISVVGGFMIACSGLGILKIKDFKTLNMLPALAVPPLWFILLHFAGQAGF